MPGSSPQHGYAPINGIEMYFDVRGAGRALLFLHAGIADCRMWDAQVDFFAKTHRVVRCDLRGFGRTLKAAGEFSHCEDVAGLLRFLGVDRTTLIGASFGGLVATDLVLTHPELVDRLVLAAPALGGYTFESPEVLEYFAAEEEALARQDLLAATEATLRMWVDGFGRPPGRVRSEIRNLVRAMVADIYTQPSVSDAHETELAPPAAARLHQIGTPTLTLAGEHDAPEFRALAKLIAEKVPKARHEVISRAAHLMNLENPDDFNRAVSGFVS